MATKKVAKQRTTSKQAVRKASAVEIAMKASTKRVAGTRAAVPAQGDWRADMLGRARALILDADPDAVEDVKRRKPSNPAGVPVWSHGGIVCTGETYRTHVKLTFARGAELEDPDGLFNAGLDGKVRRAIDLREGDRIDARAFKRLFRAAVALNRGKAR